MLALGALFSSAGSLLGRSVVALNFFADENVKGNESKISSSDPNY